MSLHDVHVPTREELLRFTERRVPAAYKTASLALAAIGAIVFIAGLFLAPDRAWRAFHWNWLFFANLSSAGVMFVAVQRIATARWSRPVVRFLEGYAAFLPVAFVFLAIELLASGHHLWPWTHERPPVAEKVFFMNHTFVTVRQYSGPPGGSSGSCSRANRSTSDTGPRRLAANDPSSARLASTGSA